MINWNLLPIVLIKNEEIWIERVLKPLTNVFDHVIVGDTGSTDATVEIVARLPKIEFTQFGELEGMALTMARAELQKIAKSFGANYVLGVDGDEIYSTSACRQLIQSPMLEPKDAGFTMAAIIGERDGGLCSLDCGYASRLAIWSVDCGWLGAYPFESQAVWRGDDVAACKKYYYYYPPPLDMEYHHAHVHQLLRSSKDAEVVTRNEKRFQHAMIDITYGKWKGWNPKEVE